MNVLEKTTLKTQPQVNAINVLKDAQDASSTLLRKDQSVSIVLKHSNLPLTTNVSDNAMKPDLLIKKVIVKKNATTDGEETKDSERKMFVIDANHQTVRNASLEKEEDLESTMNNVLIVMKTTT